jgi:hypothetical protein
MSPRSVAEASLEAVCSTLIVLEEQLAITQYQAHLTGSRPTSLDRLIAESEMLIGMLPAEWKQAALAHLRAVCALRVNDAEGMTDSLGTLGFLISLVTHLGDTLEHTWGTALARQHVLLTITALVACQWYQEAIQVQFEAEATLEPTLQPPPQASSSVSQPDQTQASGIFFRDLTSAQPFWAVMLALPIDKRWLHALLAEAWYVLTTKLDIVFENAAGPENPHVPASPNGSLSPQELQAIRSGYIGYAARQARGHAFACANPAVWKACRDLKDDVPSDNLVEPRAAQASTNSFNRRAQLLGEVWRVSEDRISGWLELFGGQGWRRLGIDPWDRTMISLLGVASGLAALLLIGLLYVIGALPAQSARIGDMRIATNYAQSAITSGALAGDDWLVLGTAGQGVQAYHRDSGHWGLWRSFTSATTKGGLLNDTVLQATGNADGMWYVVDKGGLSWSTPQLTDWQPLVGVRGFANLGQDEVVAAVLSSDNRYLAVCADRAGLGVYDTRAHDWVAQTALSSPGIALAFQGDTIFVGSDAGIASFRLMPENTGVRMQADDTRSIQGIEVMRFHTGPQWLLAVTQKQGLLGLSQTQGSRWRWLVGETGLATQDIKPRDITAVALDNSALWIAVGDRVGRYDLDSHSWQTTQPDGSPVEALATFAGRGWAGTAKGVYSQENGTWQKISQADGNGARQLLIEKNRLWTVTDDGGLGFIQSDNTWTSVIPVIPFARASDAPTISDVASYKDELWVASSGSGVASYDWKRHTWNDRRQGLGDATTVPKLQVIEEDIWALANSGRTATPPYSAWRWAGQNWVPLTDTKGLELTAAAGAAWLLADTGELLRLSSAQPQRFYQGVSFDPVRLRAFASDPKLGRVLVAGEEGLFAYDTGTHNWQQLASAPLRDVSVAGGSVVSATGDGGLTRDQRTLLPDGSVRGFGTPMTAARWQDVVWVSDGQRIATYTPATHALKEAPGLSNATVLQLRTYGDQLLALGQTTSARHLYHYDTTGTKWMQVDPGADVAGYGVWGTSVVTFDRNEAMHVWEQGQNTDYCMGAYAGLQDMTQVLRTDDGTVWALSPSAGIASYSPARGVWTTADVPHPTQVAVAKNSRGQNVILAIGSDGLYQQPNPGESLQKADSSNRPVRALAQAGGNTLVLLDTPPAIARWNGQSLDQPTRVFTSTAEGAPSELVGVGNQLWARQGTEAVAYQPGNLAYSARIPLPLGASERARLVSGDTLYLGTQTECWQLNANAWGPCPSSNYLVQPRTTLTDTYRRFEWQVAPLVVRVSGSGVADDHFLSDRVTELQITADGLLHVGSAAGTWLSRPSTGGSGWSSRSYTADKANSGVPSPITFASPGDKWTWTVKVNGSALTDTLTISWSPQPDLVRRVVEGRFADENVTAVSFFQDRIWVGTQAGVWMLPSDATSIEQRQWIAEVGDVKVARLLADSATLYAVMANGQIWKYGGGRWQSVTEVAQSAFQVANDQLGRRLFWQTSSGIETAALTSSNPRRFRQDQMQSIAGQGEDLWLATSDVIWHMKPTRDSLVAQPFETPISSGDKEWRLLADRQGVFAYLVGENSPTVFRLAGDRATQADIARSPFAPDARLSAQLAGVPLRWQRTGGTSISPNLESSGATIALTWYQGRLSSDVVNGIAFASDRLYVATQSGALVYQQGMELSSLVAVPEGQLAGKALATLGPMQGGLWAQAGADKDTFYALSESDGAVRSEQIDDKTQVLRTAVSLERGNWQTSLLPANLAPLAFESREAAFASDGRFGFDHINDAAISPTGVLVGTDAGALKYDAAPLRKILVWDPGFETRVGLVAAEDGNEYAQTTDGIYMRAATDGAWKTTPDSGSLLPLGVSLQDTGWKTAHWDANNQEHPIQVAGLERSDTLFGLTGKFLFDEVRGATQTATEIWLLTDAGWVTASRIGTTPGFKTFRFRGGDGLPSGFAPQRVHTDQAGDNLIVDGENLQLIWPITKDKLGKPLQDERASRRAQLIAATYAVSDLREGLIAIVQHGRQEPAVITASTLWFWPFNYPAFFRRSLPSAKVFLEDSRALWCVTDHELVRIDRTRMDLR